MLFEKGDKVYFFLNVINKELREGTIGENIKIPYKNTSFAGNDVIVVNEIRDKEVFQIYVERRFIFFNKENCEKASELYSDLNQIYLSDESKKIGKRLEEIMRRKNGRD